MAYPLGPVKPHVRSAAETIGALYDVETIYGVASRSYASDHPLGLALDFMVGGNRAQGEAIAIYCQTNAAALGIKYIIWYQKIWSAERASDGWRPMENRGSITANHMDHVHVSFLSSGSGVPGNGGNAITISAPDLTPDWLSNAATVFRWMGDTKNWMRVGLILSGIVLLLFALAKMAATQTGIIPSAVRKVTKK